MTHLSCEDKAMILTVAPAVVPPLLQELHHLLDPVLLAVGLAETGCSRLHVDVLLLVRVEREPEHFQDRSLFEQFRWHNVHLKLGISNSNGREDVQTNLTRGGIAHMNSNFIDIVAAIVEECVHIECAEKIFLSRQ